MLPAGPQEGTDRFLSEVESVVVNLVMYMRLFVSSIYSCNLMIKFSSTFFNNVT